MEILEYYYTFFTVYIRIAYAVLYSWRKCAYYRKSTEPGRPDVEGRVRERGRGSRERGGRAEE